VAPDSLHVDMRGLSRLIQLDPTQRWARVQAGMTWRDLQELIDPHDLSVDPEAIEFARIKHALDPANRFRNRLWDRYLPR
jgi:FAD/FMN-containing dehydrogenase